LARELAKHGADLPLQVAAQVVCAGFDRSPQWLEGASRAAGQVIVAKVGAQREVGYWLEQRTRHPLAEKVENVEVGRVAASGSMAEHARTVEFDAARLGA